MRSVSWLVPFVLGACAGATVSSRAEVPSDSQEAETPETEGTLPVSGVVTLAIAERRGPESGKAEIAILARGEEAFVGKLTLAAGAGVPEHQDPTEEYIHVLSGHGTITIDGQETALSPGDTVFMQAGATVSYANGDEDMVAVQVFAGPSSADKYQGWPLR